MESTIMTDPMERKNPDLLSEPNLQPLLKVRNDIPNILYPHRHPNQIRGDTGRDLLRIAQLRMRRRRGVNDEGLGIAHVREVACKLEVVHDARGGLDIAFDAEGEHATEGVGAEELFREVV